MFSRAEDVELAAGAANLAENLPDGAATGVAIGIAREEEHLADLLFRILSREDRRDYSNYAISFQAVNIGNH